jgi:pSer/pThr/pTyr-binding forkhead associated (FHA) protein
MSDAEGRGVEQPDQNVAGDPHRNPRAGSGAEGAPGAPQPARLEVMTGNASGMLIIIEEELIIGRDAEGAGRLAEDDEISRLHARITRVPNRHWTIEDLGSTNGTLVNGLRIDEPVTLAQDDTIQLGATTLVVRELPGEAPQPPEPIAAQPTLIGRVPLTPPVPTEATEATEAPTPTTVALRIELDFAAREAQIVVDDGAEPLRLIFEPGRWRAVPPAA